MTETLRARVKSQSATPNGAPDGANYGAEYGAEYGAVRRSHAPFPPVKPGGNGAISVGTKKLTVLGTNRNGAEYGAGYGAKNGAGYGAPHGAPRSAPRLDITAEALVTRLEDAGRTLLALPNTGYTTKLRTTQLDIVAAAVEAYATTQTARLRPAMPDAQRITRMDEALAWIPLIARDRYVLRRIVGARALVSPVTERHLYTWRRLGILLGADHKAIQRWHGEGIALIRAALAA